MLLHHIIRFFRHFISCKMFGILHSLRFFILDISDLIEKCFECLFMLILLFLKIVANYIIHTGPYFWLWSNVKRLFILFIFPHFFLLGLYIYYIYRIQFFYLFSCFFCLYVFFVFSINEIQNIIFILFFH